MNIEEIKELRKLLPCKMLVWDDDETPPEESIVINIFNDECCRTVDRDDEEEFHSNDYYGTCYYMHCKPIPQKITRPMTHAGINRWWLDQVRAGRNPAGNVLDHLYFFPPSTDIPLSGITFCADYTGTEADVFLPLTHEVDE
jgi:hypothetical protein